VRGVVAAELLRGGSFLRNMFLQSAPVYISTGLRLWDQNDVLAVTATVCGRCAPAASS
jgi:hypothetical protein